MALRIQQLIYWVIILDKHVWIEYGHPHFYHTEVILSALASQFRDLSKNVISNFLMKPKDKQAR